jgi:hypothetical protein
MSKAMCQMLGFAILLPLLAVHPTEAQQKEEWTWVDKSGKTHTRAELDAILKKAGRYAAPYPGEELVGAKMWWADLRGLYWIGANLSGADLMGANLTNGFLKGAHLDRTILATAQLEGSRLEEASLHKANLNWAHLRRADLRDADLSGAVLGGAELDGAIFEPTSLPEARDIAGATGLEFLTYENRPDALVQLRKQFQDGGFREQERKITYALRRREARQLWAACTSRKFAKNWIGEPTEPRPITWSSDSKLANCASFVLNTVFFDWTCQYGLSPGRPLSLGVLLWILCALLYFACLHTSGETGLYRVYSQSITEDPSAHRRVERIVPPGGGQTGETRRFLFQFFSREWSLLRTSMFFSLMSAFNIGFRDIDFGRWLRLLTKQEFDIKARGWARVVAGWQSLISVFLIALWVLTFFGRPFA